MFGSFPKSAVLCVVAGLTFVGSAHAAVASYSIGKVGSFNQTANNVRPATETSVSVGVTVSTTTANEISSFSLENVSGGPAPSMGSTQIPTSTIRTRSDTREFASRAEADAAYPNGHTYSFTLSPQGTVGTLTTPAVPTWLAAPYFTNGDFNAVQTMDVTQPFTFHYDLPANSFGAFASWTGAISGTVNLPSTAGAGTFTVPANRFSTTNLNLVQITYQTGTLPLTGSGFGSAPAASIFTARTSMQFSVTAPEPASLGLLVTGMGILVHRQKRSR